MLVKFVDGVLTFSKDWKTFSIGDIENNDLVEVSVSLDEWQKKTNSSLATMQKIAKILDDDMSQRIYGGGKFRLRYPEALRLERMVEGLTIRLIEKPFYQTDIEYNGVPIRTAVLKDGAVLICAISPDRNDHTIMASRSIFEVARALEEYFFTRYGKV